MLSEKLKQFRANRKALEDKKEALLAQLKDDQQALDKLELEIVSEVLSLKKTQKVEGLPVSRDWFYSSGESGQPRPGKA